MDDAPPPYVKQAPRLAEGDNTSGSSTLNKTLETRTLQRSSANKDFLEVKVLIEGWKHFLLCRPKSNAKDARARVWKKVIIGWRDGHCMHSLIWPEHTWADGAERLSNKGSWINGIIYGLLDLRLHCGLRKADDHIYRPDSKSRWTRNWEWCTSLGFVSDLARVDKSSWAVFITVLSKAAPWQADSRISLADTHAGGESMHKSETGHPFRHIQGFGFTSPEGVAQFKRS